MLRAIVVGGRACGLNKETESERSVSQIDRQKPMLMDRQTG